MLLNETIPLTSHLIPGRRLCLVLALAVVALGCGEAQPQARPPVDVVVATPVQRDVPVYGEWVGSTVGFIDATIRPQVKGFLLKRHYNEGGLVAKGDLLFEIDPREFQAQLDQARAILGEARAMLGKSELDVKRYTPLAAQGAVSQQELDDAIQARLRNRASVDKGQADVREAKLHLDWTRVTSPIDGVAGIAIAQIGDLVDQTTELTTVSQLDPIKVEFQISEREYLAFAPRVSPGKIAQGGGTEGALELTLADGSRYPHDGTAFVVGREVDPTTGTITIEGRFPNPGNLLRPGQFAKVRAVVTTAKNALLVPERAVMQVQGAHQLAVLGEGDVAEIRSVEVGTRVDQQWVIAKGLKPDDKVIVAGGQKLRAGAKVAVKSDKPATPAVASGPPASPKKPGTPAVASEPPASK